ncbi:MAG: hypothetical protein AB7L76_23695 [Burkholderiaceae bacterium]
MLIEAHVAKWRRFHAIRRRFDPIDEFELWFWATASGATALINAALHATGVTQAARLFPTQIEHVYAGVDEDMRCRRKLAIEGDLIVLGVPPLRGSVPRQLRTAIESMRAIEAFREPLVRGGAVPDLQAVATCERAYAIVVAETRATLAEGARQP